MTSPYITSLRPVNPDDARPDQKAVLDHAWKQVGFIPNMYANMANVPAVLDTYLQPATSDQKESADDDGMATAWAG